jgi:alanine racemase
MRSCYPTDNRSWIELDGKAAEKNLSAIRRFAGNAKVYAVVKSNAYGHGLEIFSELMDKASADGFCVDTVPEGLVLREGGIRKPILVLGYSSEEEWQEAAESGITVSVASLSSLQGICTLSNSPEFHLKVDTGMRRQGILPDEAGEAAEIVKNKKGRITGIFTHFASAKDINYPGFTDSQVAAFNKAEKKFRDAGFDLVRHVSATAGTLISEKYRFDIVRAGIGLYGYYPSKELEVQLGDIGLRPVMKWKSRISEVKNAKKGDYVGYDLTERLMDDCSIAVVPVGYWHGLPRGLSGIAEFTVNGERCKIIGRISMDMTVIRVPAGTKIGDEVVVMDDAAAFSRLLGGSHYEVITRINPAIRRVLV